MNTEDKSLIKQAFLSGGLRVKSVDPETGKTRLSVISDVLRHDSQEKCCVRVSLVDGRSSVFTEDHSLFYKKGDGIVSTPAGSIRVGDSIITVLGDSVSQVEVSGVEKVEDREYMYDLSVPGDQNFTLCNGILAHNSYSIGGISLDIDKSSKYESLKNNAESQFEKALEFKARTVKVIRGLQQPKYGVGIRSSFGPHVGRGVLSPRNFLVFVFIMNFVNALFPSLFCA